MPESLEQWMDGAYRLRVIRSALDYKVAVNAADVFAGVKTESVAAGDGRWTRGCEARLSDLLASIEDFRARLLPCPECAGVMSVAALCPMCRDDGTVTPDELRRQIKEERREVGSLQAELGQRCKRLKVWEAALKAADQQQGGAK